MSDSQFPIFVFGNVIPAKAGNGALMTGQRAHDLLAARIDRSQMETGDNGVQRRTVEASAHVGS